MARLTVPFYIHVVGDDTGEVFRGEFSAKTRLSHRDELQRDRVRRELLGPDPQNAEENSIARAMAFSELRVRLTSYPDWWAASGFGLDLFDENVIAELYSECMRIEREERELMMKRGTEALDELRKVEPPAKEE